MDATKIALVIEAAANTALTRYARAKAQAPDAHRAWPSYFIEELQIMARSSEPADASQAGDAARDSDGARAPCAAPAPARGGKPAAARRINLARPHHSWRDQRPRPGADRDVSIGAAVASVDPVALAEALGFPRDVTIEFISWDFVSRCWRFSLRGAGLPKTHPSLEPDAVELVVEGAPATRLTSVHAPNSAPGSDA